MGSERARDLGRGASEVDDQFALRIELLEVIVAHFRDREPVAGEDERGLEGRCGVDAEGDRGGVAERERHLAPVAHQAHAGMSLVDRPCLELDRLKEAHRAGGPEPEFFEFTRHVIGRLAMPRAAGVASLQRIVGQERDMRPPALAVRRVSRADTQPRGRHCDHQSSQARSKSHQSAPLGGCACGAGDLCHVRSPMDVGYLVGAGLGLGARAGRGLDLSLPDAETEIDSALGWMISAKTRPFPSLHPERPPNSRVRSRFLSATWLPRSSCVRIWASGCLEHHVPARRHRHCVHLRK